jgi:hypothetical protein
MQIKSSVLLCHIKFQGLFCIITTFEHQWLYIHFLKEKSAQWSTKHFHNGKKKKSNIVKKKKRTRNLKGKARVVSWIFVSLTSYFCVVYHHGKKSCDILKILFEIPFNAWFMKVSLIPNNNENRLFELLCNISNPEFSHSRVRRGGSQQ